MFEKYTEKARRVIFFARYEASQFGSPRIETEHLLLGLLREDKNLAHRFLPAKTEDIYRTIEAATVKGEKVSTSVDLPVSEEAKRVLIYAAEEAERLFHKHIGTEHLLLGLLRKEKCFAARILNEHGVRLSSVREELARSMQEPQEIAPKVFVLLSEFSGYMTRIAREERRPPLIGREKEFEQMVHILGRSNKNNVVLMGEPGVGKKTIVEELVQRVADNAATAFLQGKLFVSIDLAMIVTAAQHSRRSTEFLNAITAEMIKAEKDTLFFFDELHALLAAGPESGAHEITLLLKSALLSGKVRCIASATTAEHHAALEKAPWLNERFLAVKVEAPTVETAIKILQVEKDRFEKFHSVQFTDEAITAAVVLSNRLVANHSLPDKAIDVIDDAGAYVKMKQEKAVLPEEVVEARKRLKFISARHENAVENHEFEKARFYSDEERTQREALAQLHLKHDIPERQVVGKADIEEALARWTGMPIEAVREISANSAIESQKLKASPKKKPKKKKS
ncbi:MAG TPA: Clp protease N-terminal domain-containing protein [Candidatus Angelobacter sp.]|jgi:ATP-dependent Clp protease ATP-binding subunit ClpC